MNESAGLPPFSEQQAIADYLDLETAKIDALVAKQKALIAVLQEKHTALVKHAVAKGLDPDAAMKDSGVEWLGGIPARWEVIRLKSIAEMRSGDAITALDIEPDGDYPVYGGNGVRGYVEYCTHDGDHVLIGRQGAHCGNVHLASGRFWASEHALVVSLGASTSTRWLAGTLASMDLNQHSVSAAQPGLAVERLTSLPIPLPPLSEQRAIADHLDREKVKLDALVAKARECIDRLGEYRTALVSAAVTGQIDVRCHSDKSTCQHASHPQLYATHHTPSHRHRIGPR